MLKWPWIRLLLLWVVCVPSAWATIGMAEWEIETPGGNRISHVDPLKEIHGTCLRGAAGGADGDAVHVARLEWWIYYRGYVVGKSAKGYFIFDEVQARVENFGSESELRTAVTRRRLGPPASRRLEPRDGWKQVWDPLFRDQCRKLANGEEEFASLTAGERDRIRRP